MTKTPSSSSTADEHRISDTALINKLGWTFGGIMTAFLIIFGAISTIHKWHTLNITPIAPTAIESPTEWEKGVEQGLQSLDKNQAVLDQRINDLQYLLDHNSMTLAMIATFFGALITVVVIFFALRQGDMVREVVDDARSKVHHMDDTIKRAEKILEKIEEHKTEIDKKVEAYKKHADKAIDNQNKKIKSMINMPSSIEDDKKPKLVEIKFENSSIEQTTFWNKIRTSLKNQSASQILQSFPELKKQTNVSEQLIILNYAIGIAYADLNEHENAINQLIKIKEEHDHIPHDLIKQIAESWYHYTITLVKKYMKENDARMFKIINKSYNLLIEWLKQFNEKSIEIITAKAWVNLGAFRTNYNSSDITKTEVLAIFDNFQEWAKNKEAYIDVYISTSFKNQLIAMRQLCSNNSDKLISAYYNHIDWGKPKNDANIRLDTAISYGYLTDLLIQNHQYRKAIDECVAGLSLIESLKYEPSKKHILSQLVLGQLYYHQAEAYLLLNQPKYYSNIRTLANKSQNVLTFIDDPDAKALLNGLEEDVITPLKEKLKSENPTES